MQEDSKFKGYIDKARVSFSKLKDKLNGAKTPYINASIVAIASLLLVALLVFEYQMSKQSEHFDLGVVSGGSAGHTQVSQGNGDVPEALQGESSIPVPESNKTPSGVMFTSMNTAILERELNTLSGWTPNDYLPLTSLLDNKINFQKGVREVVLRNVFSLRETLSRQDRTTSSINPKIDSAYGYISVRSDSWLFPSYEGQLKKAVKDLHSYRESLYTGEAGFYPRADTLVKVLEQYASLIGGATNTLNGEDMTFFDQDDRFYFAKGISYAIYQSALAIRIEFNDALMKNGGDKIMDSIVDQLQKSYFEPDVVMSSDVDSWRNNHTDRSSRMLLSVRQKMNSLSSILLHRGSPSGG